MKTCVDCKVSKSLDEFYKRKSGFHEIRCKGCQLIKYSPNYGKPNLGRFKKGNTPWNKKYHLGRQSIELRTWREEVKKRDNYRCVKCASAKRLHAHHIKDWHNHPELRFDVSNGMTLCTSCHAYIHGKEKCNMLKNGIPWLKGKKMSDELKKKLSQAHLGQIPWNKGKRKASGDLA